MKKFFPVLLIGLFLIMALSACTVAPAAGSAGVTTSVNDGQMYLIGLAASAILYGLKLLASAYPKITIKREWLTVLLYVIAWTFSVIWGGIVFPTFGTFVDPVTFVAALFAWITALLVAVAPSVSFATLIYNILLKRVFDGWAGKG